MKKNSFWTFSTFFLTLASMSMISAGCSQKKVKPEDEIASPQRIEDNSLGSSDHGNALGLKTVHFAYDSPLLTDEAKQILKENQKILKDHSQVKVQIEGYCDNRGGIQYNLALGEKRANSVKLFLKGLGISEDRLSTVSYGKERPLVEGDSEDAYAQNRRANFAITAK